MGLSRGGHNLDFIIEKKDFLRKDYNEFIKDILHDKNSYLLNLIVDFYIEKMKIK